MNRWTMLGCALALGLGISACDGGSSCDLAADGVCPAGCPSDPDCTSPEDGGPPESDGGMATPVVGFGDDLDTLTAADYSCLGTNTAPPTDGTEVSFTGLAEDFFNNDPVEGLTIQFFPDNMPTIDATCTAPCVEVTSGSDGTFSLMANQGSWYGYRVKAGTGMQAGTPTDYIEAVVTNNEVPAAGEQDTFLAVQSSTRDTIITLLGVTLETGTATVTGSVADCAGNDIANADVRMFDASGEIDLGFGRTGAREFYFDGASFPRGAQRLTNVDGLFGAANVPIPADGIVRVEIWGATEAGGDPVLLGCESTPVIADGITAINIGPLRSDAPAGCGG